MELDAKIEGGKGGLRPEGKGGVSGERGSRDLSAQQQIRLRTERNRRIKTLKCRGLARVA